MRARASPEAPPRCRPLACTRRVLGCEHLSDKGGERWLAEGHLVEAVEVDYRRTVRRMGEVIPSPVWYYSASHTQPVQETIPSHSCVSQFGDTRPQQLPQDDPQPAIAHVAVSAWVAHT
eukprot:1619085-Prymnesium_polylepis.1